ncbi:MAG: hypothetical protein ACYTF8_00245 [Planctomycetota bacterium]
MAPIARAQSLRYVDEGPWRGRLETALWHYRSQEGVEVVLVGVMHLADEAYYRDLSRRLRAYDAVLYEGVPGTAAPPGIELPWWFRALRRADRVLGRLLESALDLKRQGDVLDHSAANFVHADLDAATYDRLRRERGETDLELFRGELRLLGGFLAERIGDPPQPKPEPEERRRALKAYVARVVESLNRLAARELERARPTVLIHDRNAAAVAVLRRQMRAGKKKLAVLYGAAHLPDLERRLVRLGFRRTRTEWLTAWDAG